MEAEPRTNRRWFQFSLRTLIASTIAVAVAAGWVGRQIEEKRAERAAVAEIVKLGGRVTYDYEKTGASRGPTWVGNVLGDDFLANVVEVNLSSSAVDDKDLSLLGNLRSLEALDISDTGVTDAGLRHVASLQNLKSLSVRNSATTFAGHHPRSPDGVYTVFTAVQIQGLNGTGATYNVFSFEPRITDECLEHLVHLKNLESLDLEGTGVTSNGIAKLRGMARLAYLNVRGTNVSDAAIAALENALPKLKVERHFPPTESGMGGRVPWGPGSDALIDLGTPLR